MRLFRLFALQGRAAGGSWPKESEYLSIRASLPTVPKVLWVFNLYSTLRASVFVWHV